MSQFLSIRADRCPVVSRLPRRSITLGALIIGSVAALAAFQTWTTDVVDASVNAGVTTGFAFAPDGSPSIAYSETAKTDSLFFAKGTPTASPSETQRERIDSARSINGGITLLYNPVSGRPGIAYSAGDLRYASHDGTRWNIEVITRTGTSSDFAFDSAGFPAIAFLSPNGKTSDLKVARRTVSGWTIEVVQLKAGVDSLNIAIAFDHTDAPAVAFCKDHTLFLARRNASGWNTSAIDSVVSTSGFQFGFQPDLAFDPAGNAAIAYMSEAKSESPLMRHLYYSVYNGTGLQRTTVDTMAVRGTSLAFDRGEPAMAYVGVGASNLRFAYRSAGIWTVEIAHTVASGQVVGLPALGFAPIPTFDAGIGWTKHPFPGNNVMFTRRSP